MQSLPLKIEKGLILPVKIYAATASGTKKIPVKIAISRILPVFQSFTAVISPVNRKSLRTEFMINNNQNNPSFLS